MNQKPEEVNLSELLENEAGDIWDIFFPYMSQDDKVNVEKNTYEKAKTHRHLRFLTM